MSAKGPPIGSLPHITTSINSAAERSTAFSGHMSQPAVPTTMPPTKAKRSTSLLTASPQATPNPSRAEGQASASVRDQQLVRHLFAHGANEVFAATVHRDD